MYTGGMQDSVNPYNYAVYSEVSMANGEQYNARIAPLHPETVLPFISLTSSIYLSLSLVHYVVGYTLYRTNSATSYTLQLFWLHLPGFLYLKGNDLLDSM